VVASAVGGIPDYVWEGRNGVLFQPNDVADCVRAIRAASRHARFGRGEVAADALAEAREYLSPARMGAAFAEIYAQLAARK
jgi:glycosyltransferase involved in cell wall biosynthesis